MSLLEKIQQSVPKHKTKIPSTGQVTFFRPFLMREQKILLIAQQAQNHAESLKAVATVVEACVEEVDNGLDLSLCDLEYLFSQIRAKSVSETAEPTFTCPKTGETIKTGIRLTEVKISDEKTNPNIKITDKLKIVMRSPTVKDHILVEGENWFDKLIGNCISKVIFEDEVFESGSISDEERMEIIDTMTQHQYDLCSKFIHNQPHIYADVKYRTSDGEIREVTFRGLKDFFS
jgi:hypothetical protein|tara:strand:- start:744 stop:1439 length:696 start_codon:yes stop_codon:yes gene_type:complete